MADYPGSITSFTDQVNCADPIIDEYSLDAADVNDTYGEVVAIETELGTDPAGSEATVADRLDAIDLARLPIGGIIMWSGLYSNIPSGFTICTGGGGTPNLSNRFICATTGTGNPGTTGGTHALTLSLNNMPIHNHTASSNSTAIHNHTINSAGIHNHSILREAAYASGSAVAAARQGGPGSWSGGDPVQSSGNHNHTSDNAGGHSHTITVQNAGSSQGFNNRPLYYELCFIMRTS